MTKKEYDEEQTDLLEKQLSNNDYKNNFTSDKEKMKDFYILTKEEFLKSYSYLTEREYNNTIKARLDYLRQEIEAERISTGEIAELQGLKQYIEPSNTLLLEWAGVEEIDRENMAIAINTLKGLLSWSDRIGSDERATIQLVINTLNNKHNIN